MTFSSQSSGAGEDYEPDALTIEATLACLDFLISTWNCDLDDRTLVFMTAYTDSRDPWTTEKASLLASRLIKTSIPRDRTENFIVYSILQRYLRSIFSKPTSKLTTSGRPSQFPDQGYKPRDGLEPPSWKKQGLQVISVFRWAIRTSSVGSYPRVRSVYRQGLTETAQENLVSNNWPLFTPVLLAISEDEDPSIRALGLEILTDFIDKCPSQILKSTGIGTVFQEAIFPSLLFLPSLTPEEESVKLMRQAYGALVTLAEKEANVANLGRRQLLDKTVRDGILAAYEHASQYVGVVETLMETTTTVVNCLEIFSVKHLQVRKSMKNESPAFVPAHMIY